MRDKLLQITRYFVGFVAASGFLFGQLFNNSFSVGASQAGFAGVASAVMGHRRSKSGRIAAVLASAVGLVGVALDVHRYDTWLNIRGSHYAWELIGPFAVGMLGLAVLNAIKAKAGAGARVDE